MGLDLSSLLDPGAIAHQIVDSVLPKDMQWVGGVVGAAVDYQCGNAVGAVKQGESALSDLKDVPQSAPANKPAASASTDAAKKTALSSTQAAPSQQWTYEPSPPQPRATTTTTATTTTVTSGPGTAPTTEAKPSPPTTSAGARSAQNLPPPPKTRAASGGWRPSTRSLVRPEPPSPGFVGHPPAQTPTAASATGPASRTVTTTTTTISGATPSAPTMGPSSAGSDLVRLATESAARLQSSAPSSSTPASGGAAAPSATPESTPPAKASAGASSAAAAKPSTADPSTLSSDKFMNLSDDDLMKAVREGKIPTDVTDSQAGMMALQARMDHISEMNKMMTSMMEAMHQMKMGVIENLRA